MLEVLVKNGREADGCGGGCVRMKVVVVVVPAKAINKKRVLW